jgi:hypothetical protein
MSRARRAMSSALPQLLRLMMRGDLHRGRAFVLHAAQAQAALQAQRDLGLHVGQLLLDQLVGGQRAAELLAVQHVYWRARCQQNSAAPSAPQAMP